MASGEDKRLRCNPSGSSSCIQMCLFVYEFYTSKVLFELSFPGGPSLFSVFIWGFLVLPPKVNHNRSYPGMLLNSSLPSGYRETDSAVHLRMNGSDRI